MTTTATGLLCWRDSHPLEWQLALAALEPYMLAKRTPTSAVTLPVARQASLARAYPLPGRILQWCRCHFGLQLYGDAARATIANLSPQLGWLAPQTAPVAQTDPVKNGPTGRKVLARDDVEHELQILIPVSALLLCGRRTRNVKGKLHGLETIRGGLQHVRLQLAQCKVTPCQGWRQTKSASNMAPL
jgi:hypothetical protein